MESTSPCADTNSIDILVTNNNTDIMNNSTENATDTAGGALPGAASTITAVTSNDITDMTTGTTNITECSTAAPPVGDVAPPVGDVVTPASDVAPPVSDIAPPVSDIAPPVSDVAPPVSDVAQPVGDAASSTPADDPLPLPPPPTSTKMWTDWIIVGTKLDDVTNKEVHRIKSMRVNGANKYKVTIITSSNLKRESSMGIDIDEDSFCKKNNHYELGIYSSRTEAEFAHDMQMLKLEGLNKAGQVNEDIILFAPRVVRLVAVPKVTEDTNTVGSEESGKGASSASIADGDGLLTQTQAEAEAEAAKVAAAAAAEAAKAIGVVEGEKIIRIELNQDMKIPKGIDQDTKKELEAVMRESIVPCDDPTSSNSSIATATKTALQAAAATTNIVTIDPIPSFDPFPAVQTRAQANEFNLNIKKLESDVIPTSFDAYEQSWAERTMTSYTPAVSFVYEISFSHTHSLGLNLKPVFIPYAIGLAKRSLGCLMVVETNEKLGTIVRPGDILIKVNRLELVQPFGVFSFDQNTRSITQESAPRVVRFIRPAAASISPCEVNSMLTTHPIAKFQFIVETETTPAHLSLIHLENSAPSSVKKLMSGIRVQWEFPGNEPSTSHLNPNILRPEQAIGLNQSIQPFLSAKSKSSQSSLATQLTKRRHLQRDVMPTNSPMRIYRDDGHYSVVVEYQGKLYHLGEYDLEDDALAVYKKYAMEIEKTGIFVPRKVRRTGYQSLEKASEVYTDADGVSNGTSDLENMENTDDAGVENASAQELRQLFKGTVEAACNIINPKSIYANLTFHEKPL